MSGGKWKDEEIVIIPYGIQQFLTRVVVIFQVSDDIPI
jgi:hypothetical protein